MSDTLLAAMTFSGLMGDDIGDFFPQRPKDINVEVIDTPIVSTPAEVSQEQTPENQGVSPVIYPGSIKIRTIKLRNPDLHSKVDQTSLKPLNQTEDSKSKANYPKVTERSVNLAKKIPQPDQYPTSPSITKPNLSHPQVKRPAPTEGIEFGMFQTPSQARAQKRQVLHNYGLVPGVIPNLLKGTNVESFSVQILAVNNRRVKISDGLHRTDKCFIAPEMKDIQFLDNPIIKVLEWNLVNLNLSSTKTETVIKIMKFVVIENKRDFPILGDLKGLSNVTWTSITCFLQHLNLNPVHENVDLLTEKWAKVIGGKMVTVQGSWQCNECEYYKSRQQRHIINHIQMAHLPNFPGYKCPKSECRKLVQSTGEFESHIKTDHMVGIPMPSLMANPHNTPVPSPTQYCPNTGSYRCPVLQCQLRLGNREDFDIHIKTIHHLNLKFRDDDASSNNARQPVTEAPDTATPFHKQKPDMANPFHNQIKNPDITANPFQMLNKKPDITASPHNQNKQPDITASPHNQNKQPDISAYTFQNQNRVLHTTANPFYSQNKQGDAGANPFYIQNKKPDITSNPFHGQNKQADIAAYSLHNQKSDITNLAANILGSMDSHFLTAEETNMKVEPAPVIDPHVTEDIVTLDEDPAKHFPQVNKKESDDGINWDEELDTRIMRAGVLFHCRDCDFKQMKEDLMMDHVQGKHLPNFPGYDCPRCHEQFQTLVPFMVHMKMTHKTNLTEVVKAQCLSRPSKYSLPKFNVNPSEQDWLKTKNLSLDTFIQKFNKC